VVDRQSEIDASKPEGEEISDSAPGEVELRDVTFAYPTRPDVPVFRHFNLHVPAGKVTALVGESGSGKSTIVNLVERFYDVQEGMVLVDGVNVKALSIGWLRARVRLHSQLLRKCDSFSCALAEYKRQPVHPFYLHIATCYFRLVQNVLGHVCMARRTRTHSRLHCSM
jgi:ABC-type transport system involved in Fe-S cluster assembly fused permease/ATPase subunit